MDQDSYNQRLANCVYHEWAAELREPPHRETQQVCPVLWEFSSPERPDVAKHDVQFNDWVATRSSLLIELNYTMLQGFLKRSN